MTALYGGIEAGGTKFVCAVGTGPGELVAETRFPTTTPEDTIAHTLAFFKDQQRHNPICSIGVGSFGPIDIDLNSPTFGHIKFTPKLGWENFDFVNAIHGPINVPVYIDTDVNVATLGEYHWGSGKSLNTFLYLTVGTGIGGGAIVNNRLLHGLLHPEMGHIRVPHDWAADPFPGSCPFHGDCLEGLASGAAIEERWKQSPASLPSKHSAWDLESNYLAIALVNFICTLSPQRIILGGGIMQQSRLFPLIRQKVQKLLNGYLKSVRLSEGVSDYIVPPLLEDKSGIIGAITLARIGDRSVLGNLELLQS